MLVTDAVTNEAPTHVMTLTTHNPDIGSETFGRGVQSVTRRLRRHFPRFEYLLKVEFTTGKAQRSGGYRRIHGHICCKGLIGEDVRLVEGLVGETWERVTGATVVEFAEMITAGGAIHYLGIHHGKISQAPPAGWRGMTERFSKGYLSEPVPVARARAREDLAVEALAWSTGCSLEDARFLLTQAKLERASLEAAFAEYCELRRSTADADEGPQFSHLVAQLSGTDWGRFFPPAPVSAERTPRPRAEVVVEPIDMSSPLGTEAWLEGLSRA